MDGEKKADVVVIMAPIGADAANIRSVLFGAGFAPYVCRDDADLRAAITTDCGAVLLTEEALTPELTGVLSEAFGRQPAWSDIPVVLITSVGTSNSGPLASAKLRGP